MFYNYFSKLLEVIVRVEAYIILVLKLLLLLILVLLLLVKLWIIHLNSVGHILIYYLRILLLLTAEILDRHIVRIIHIVILLDKHILCLIDLLSKTALVAILLK
jgi:hypothetical protein